MEWNLSYTSMYPTDKTAGSRSIKATSHSYAILLVRLQSFVAKSHDNQFKLG